MIPLEVATGRSFGLRSATKIVPAGTTTEVAGADASRVALTLSNMHSASNDYEGVVFTVLARGDSGLKPIGLSYVVTGPYRATVADDGMIPTLPHAVKNHTGTDYYVTVWEVYEYRPMPFTPLSGAYQPGDF